MTPAVAVGMRTLGKAPELLAEPILCLWGCWGHKLLPAWHPPSASQQRRLGLLPTVVTALSLSSAHMLAQPPHLWWARGYPQAWTDLQKGSGLFYDCKLWGEEKTAPPEVVGWTPVLVNIPPGCSNLIPQHLTQWIAFKLSPVATFFSEQNTEMFCRLVKYVFEFCKNSNVLGCFFFM